MCSLFRFVTLPLKKEAINHASARTKQRDLHKIICQEFIQLGNKSHLATQLRSHQVWKAAGACAFKNFHQVMQLSSFRIEPRIIYKERDKFISAANIYRAQQQRGNDNKNNFSSLPSAGCVAHVPAAFRSQPTTPRYLFFSPAAVVAPHGKSFPPRFLGACCCFCDITPPHPFLFIALCVLCVSGRTEGRERKHLGDAQ
jgi:hypothetical protein